MIQTGQSWSKSFPLTPSLLDVPFALEIKFLCLFNHGQQQKAYGRRLQAGVSFRREWAMLETEFEGA